MSYLDNTYNWDKYFIDIAETVRLKSKDPSTKVGAVIVGPEQQIISTGYNGFPRGVYDYDERWERPAKYAYVVHAELNAILNAARHGIALRDCDLYLVGFGPPTVPCTNCAKAIIQVGIKKVIGKSYKPAPENWMDSLDRAREMLDESNVEMVEFQ